MLIYKILYSFCYVSTFAVYLTATPLHPILHSKDIDLNSWIRHFEPAHYDPLHLKDQQQRRFRRSTKDSDRQQDNIYLNFKGHGRTFKLRLIPDKNIFAEDVVFETTNGPIEFDSNVVYTGTLEDDETSAAYGVLTKDGLFDGIVSTALEDYYIEPISRYTASNLNDRKSPNFHSIIYKMSDVFIPINNSSTFCGSKLLLLDKGKNLFRSRKKLEPKGKRRTKKKRKRRWLLEAEAKQPYDDPTIYWIRNKSKLPSARPPLFDINSPFNQPIDEELDMITTNRTYPDVSGLIFRNVNKRATIDPKKTTCMLYLQADHQFFQKYGTEEACIEVMTRHVQRVNSIYKNTDFNQDGKPDNITFMVKRIKVHTMDALRDPLYRFPNNYGVEKFLELFSEEDYDAFCLAYMFTYRDFEMGTLGLAWTGDLKNAGGVCEKNGHYRGSMKSLNTGIVTLLNYGKHVPPAVSHVTLAHEIGHNFGSPHDPETCTPGGDDGNFIMFARATSGDKKNNNQFSPCSLKSINPVLNFKARSPKGCFTEPQASLCGNGVVEDGEECDCGWEEDCRDQCCFPQRRYPPLDEPPCRLTPRSVCSPSQGPCCTTDCQVKFGDKCREDNGCRDASFCNGRGPQCPPSINKPNKTICNKEFVCFMGECTGSICLAFGLESCQCIPSKDDPKTKACELCCKLPGDGQPCISSFEWNDMPYDIPDMFSKPGTPCNDYSGYCDVFQMCREVDPSGPLATLRKLLLSEESIASFKKWVMEYWYAVALIVLTVISLLIFSTKVLGKKAKTKKSVTIMHSQTTETVRLPDGDGGPVTVHPAIRSKLPLKRKVRNGKLKRKRKIKESINNNVNSPAKSKGSPKKKKRVSAPVGAEETRKKTCDTAAVIEIPPSKVKRSSQPNAAANGNNNNNKKKKKKKEVIDYSGAQVDNNNDGKKGLINAEVVHNSIAPETDPVGKVQNWLLRSQATFPKSKSTPERLTDKNRSPHKRAAILRPSARNDKSKSHSIGNLPNEKEKVRLQVVYKPPFKFSVKLRKPDKSMSTNEQRTSKRFEKRPRAGVLVRTVKDKSQKTAVKPSVNNNNNSSNNNNSKTVTAKTTAAATTATTTAASASAAAAAAASSNVDNNHVTNATKTPTKTDIDATPTATTATVINDIDSNIHTVQSDLEVLLSESEFLFSDD